MKTARRNVASVDYARMLQDVLPEQGHWSDEQYLSLTDHSARLLELTDGDLEFLPMPTDKHQGFLDFLLDAIKAYIVPRGGKVRFAPLRLRIRPGKFREPDLLLVRDAKDPRRQNRFWTGADLTLEIVSPDDSERDLTDKRHDYAEGRVPEYWIVNPLNETILVFLLKGKKYVRHGLFKRGASGTSATLPEFSVAVNDVFDAD